MELGLSSVSSRFEMWVPPLEAVPHRIAVAAMMEQATRDLAANRKSWTAAHEYLGCHQV